VLSYVRKSIFIDFTKNNSIFASWEISLENLENFFGLKQLSIKNEEISGLFFYLSLIKRVKENVN